MLLLHGGATGASGTAVWGRMAAFLGANGFRVYCPDLPGFGLADTREAFRPVNGALSHLAFITEFVDALCIDRAHVSGNSMGCANTINFTLAHPERVRSFILVNGGLGDLVDPAKHVSSGITLPRFEGTEASMREHVKPLTYRKRALTDAVAAMRHASRQPPDGVHRRLPGRGAERRRRPEPAPSPLDQGAAGRAHHPRRLPVWPPGTTSPPSRTATTREDALPNVQFFYPDECGHVGQHDQPEMFRQVYLEFFRDGRVSRETAEWAGVSTRRPELAHLVEPAPVPAG